MPAIRLGIVGVGKIVRDQHLPAIQANPGFVLKAAASPHAAIEGVASFRTVEDMLAGAELDAVAICTPPQVRCHAAHAALAAGKHVLLEKPPCLTTTELAQLESFAGEQGRTLFQTWHSRFAPGVAPAREWLCGRPVRSIRIEWKEDVRRWHPGQTWIWQPGGLGVFDPGINALSILTEILAWPVYLRSALLQFPSNCQAPSAAELLLGGGGAASIEASFDFLQAGPQTWDISVTAQSGAVLELSRGGAQLAIDGQVLVDAAEREYAGIYERFAGLIAAGRSEVDARPFQLVADAFMIGWRSTVAPFHDGPGDA
jgi:D-galactose 1-dehydrogenase